MRSIVLSAVLAAGACVGGSRNQPGAAGLDRSAGAALDGFVLQKPCVPDFKPAPHARGFAACEEPRDFENQHRTIRFGGDPRVVYDVTLRVRGVAERHWYEGGALDPKSQLFYTGGRPTIRNAVTAGTHLDPGKGACKIHPPDTDVRFALPFAVPG